MVKNSPANAKGAGDTGSIPGLGRAPGGGNGNPLQYSCLENLMGRGARWATVHGVSQSWTGLKQFSMYDPPVLTVCLHLVRNKCFLNNKGDFGTCIK